MKRHPLNIFSLVAGVLFLTIGLVFFLDQIEVIHNVNASWMPAAILLSLGVGGILQHARPFAERRHNDELATRAAATEPSHEV